VFGVAREWRENYTKILPTDIVGIVVFEKFAVKMASGHLDGSD